MPLCFSIVQKNLIEANLHVWLDVEVRNHFFSLMPGSSLAFGSSDGVMFSWSVNIFQLVDFNSLA